MHDSHDIILKEVAPAEVGEVDLYQRREKIYTRKIEGFFQKIRLYTGWPLLVMYFGLPWLIWDSRQSVLFDLPARKFHIFGLTFWPQDFFLLALVLIVAAYGLFMVTAIVGRVWCGYTCPQTVWTAIYMYLEQLFEGSRNQRIKRDKAPWSIEKFYRKILKHGSWLFVGFLTAFTFIGYFYPIRELSVDLCYIRVSAWPASWILFFTLATYINAGWMREQVCQYMCPYARFQSVMFDHHTLIVSYDSLRGETRGARKRTSRRIDSSLGDCIDCQLCVQVCPTGIDIRDGLQYQCIGCALCIDACDSVMDKMGYPPNLISYTSESTLAGGVTHWFRPRIVGYLSVFILMVTLFAYTLVNRTPLEMTVTRDRGELFVKNTNGYIENIYTLHIINMTNATYRYNLSVENLANAQLIGNREPEVRAGEDLHFSIRLKVPPDTAVPLNQVIYFNLEAQTNMELKTKVESRFIRPEL